MLFQPGLLLVYHRTRYRSPPRPKLSDLAVHCASSSLIMFPLSSLLVLATSALAVRVSYDPVYDNRNQSLDTVLCSTGSNGLETKNFTTFGSLPNFPNIGGAEAVTGFNSPACGTCWALTYKNLTINVCVIAGWRCFNILIFVHAFLPPSPLSLDPRD